MYKAMNKPAYLILLIALLSTLSTVAQDVIYLTDGTKVDGKISLVGTDHVTYKKADNPTGPDHQLQRKEVLMIVYENGTHEVINKSGTSSGTGIRLFTNDIDTTFGRHMVSWEFMDLMLVNISISYEYFVKSGKLGVRVPLSIGLDESAYTYGNMPEVIGTRGRIFASGVDLNYYPTGQGKFKYFIGPSLGFGLNRHETDYYADYPYEEPYYDPVDSTYIYPEYDYYYERGQAQRFSLHINNGWIAQPTKNFSIIGSMGLGVITRFLNGNNLGYNPSVTLRLSAAYRF